jgi:hypothetical protein
MRRNARNNAGSLLPFGGGAQARLPDGDVRWDDSGMSENKDENLRAPGPHQHAHASSPTTQQMRTVGERRRDAEEKLEHHLQEARHKDDPPNDDAARQEHLAVVESRDVAAIQNDDRLTAADRVDLIANQVIAKGEDRPEPEGRP